MPSYIASSQRELPEFVANNRSPWLLAMALLIPALILLNSPARAKQPAGTRSVKITIPSGPVVRPPNAQATPTVNKQGLRWPDGVVIGIYICGMLGIGWYYSRKQTSTDDYFVGNRSMGPLPIGISMFVTMLSTISYLSYPGDMIKHGPFLLVGLLAIPLAYLIVAYVLIPTYMKHRVTSAYELLEARLGLSARLTGAVMFVLVKLVWMSVLVYVASISLLVMLGLDERWTATVIVAISSVAIIYSSLGGLRAVVVTDMIQFILLFGGALLVIGTVTYRLGGISWLPTAWDPTWERQPLWSLDLYAPRTVIGAIVMFTAWYVCTAGGDQTMIQRYMATRDARAARRAYLVNCVAGVLVKIVLALVGFALLSYFRALSAAGEGLDIPTKPDLLFPLYISHHLPTGLSGLIVAGMFAAAMSSVDSGVNSISAVVKTDFVDRLSGRPNSKQTSVWVAQLLALVIGLIVVGTAIMIAHVPGNFFALAKRTSGLLTAPIFTLFFMALFVPFATPRGTIVGVVCGILTAVHIAYGGPLTSGQPLSIQWIYPGSLVGGLASACLASLLDRLVKKVSVNFD